MLWWLKWCVRALNWSTLLWLYLLFLTRLGGWETERPDAWREAVFAIPKKSNLVGFHSMRYISLLLMIQKFYIRASQSATDVKENHMRQTSWAMKQGEPLLGVSATLKQAY